MNFIKQLFHFHEWKTIAKKDIPVRGFTEINGVKCSEESTTHGGFLVVQRCEKCGSEQAFLTDGRLTMPMNIEFAKSRLGIDKL